MDTQKQREGFNKRDTTPSTVSLEAIMIISCIDKSEESDVAVMDIPGSLLIADMDEIVHMMLRGDRIQG